MIEKNNQNEINIKEENETGEKDDEEKINEALMGEKISHEEDITANNIEEGIDSNYFEEEFEFSEEEDDQPYIKDIDMSILYKLITDENFFKKEDNSIVASKDQYLEVVNLIGGLTKGYFIDISRYLKMININISKVLINGYLEYDFENKEFEQKIFQSISRAINIFYDKDTFYCFYNRFSELYRRHKEINSIDSITKFNKLITVWELLYSIESDKTKINLPSKPKDNNFGSILLFPQKQNDDINESIIFDFSNLNLKKINITIIFIPSAILYLNIYDDDSCFFKIIYNDKTETKINYKDYTKDLVNFIKQISYNYDYDKRFYSIIMNEVNIEKKTLEKKQIFKK